MEKMTHDELVELLGELFDDESIGCIGETTPNGNGMCTCPSCSAIEDLKHEGCGMEPMGMIINHDDDCKLYRLYAYVSANRK